MLRNSARGLAWPACATSAATPVSEDLLKNGLELESVSLTRLDQTPIKYFDAQNAFDAEGLTKLTQQTQQCARERNEIEQDTSVAIAKKNYEAT